MRLIVWRLADILKNIDCLFLITVLGRLDLLIKVADATHGENKYLSLNKKIWWAKYQFFFRFFILTASEPLLAWNNVLWSVYILIKKVIYFEKFNCGWGKVCHVIFVHYLEAKLRTSHLFISMARDNIAKFYR